MTPNRSDSEMDSSNNGSSFSERLKRLPGDLRNLSEKRLELWTINIAEQITRIVTGAVFTIIGAVLLAMGGLLLLFALAIYVGELVGDESLGYLIVATPFLLLGLLLAYRRPKWLIARSQNRIMEEFYSSLQDNIDQEDSDIASDADTEHEHDNEKST